MGNYSNINNDDNDVDNNDYSINDYSINDNKNNNCIFNEIKRVYLFYKKRYDILILVIVISFLLYNSFNSMHKINNTKKKGILKGGGEGDLSKYLLNTSILENLKEQFPLDKKINYVMVGFGYFMLAFVVRPIKGFFFFILIIFAVSSSFLFPFLLFGTMLYFVMKKIITNKKPSLEL
jgi:hypothetical protein